MSDYAGSLATQFFVRFKDHLGSEVILLDDWVHLEYENQVDDRGYFTIQMFANDTERFGLIREDYLIEVWRSNRDQGVDWYMDFDGLVTTISDDQDEDGMRQLIVSGAGLNDLLARRIIAYRKGDTQSDKDGPAETVMKEYVDENCGPHATMTGDLGDLEPHGGYPRLLPGTMTGFTVDGSLGRGPTWTGSRGFENLLDTLQVIATFSNFDFAVIQNGPAAFQFRVYPDQLGSDRTTLGLDAATGLNGAGFPPVVFAPELGTTIGMSYKKDRSSEQNAIIVSGPGDGATQWALARTKPNAYDDTPWAQREGFLSATDVEFMAQMEDAGDAELDVQQFKESLDFQPMQQPSLLYGRDYFIGDRVTAKYGAIEVDKRLTNIRVRVSSDGQAITVTMKDVRHG